MKTPTLEEVRERFKDAKIVQDWTGDKRKVTFKKLTQTEDGSVIQEFSKKNWCVLFHNKQGYAKILSYKEPKEKTYKITREQILEISEKFGNDNSLLAKSFLTTHLKQIFPEVFETKLTAGKWYKGNFLKENNPLVYINHTDKKGNIKCYGFDEGKWFDQRESELHYGSINEAYDWIEATEQEVTEALTKEAVRIGYKNGNYNCLFLPKLTHKVVENFHYRKEDDTLYQGENQYSKNNAVYSKGKWAEILETLTIQEAEAKLKEIGVNCKIL